ncbi:MAG: aminotransferase class V-fold PLP-dependent enzyme [Clostridia bacterium]|nr:aminotransferase class V-fold PLP-dependent enzyme [Clostridia bacterium]
MIYLDNSSTTHKKPKSVISTATLGMKKYSINPSRVGYKRGIEVQEEVFKCREKLSEYIGTTADKIIFTSGCTSAINMGLRGTAKRNGHIITTIFEHNSVLRTLEDLKQTHNISYTTLTPNKEGQIPTSEIAKAIKSNTYMIIINHTSNVTGATQNIEKIGKIAKKHNLIFFVDGAQSVGHEKINMQEMNINLLSIAGHKGLYAPQGIGVLAINDCIVTPTKTGGTGTYSEKLKQPTNYPEGLESGTQNIVGILGLYAGLEFVIKHQEKINTKIHTLTQYLVDKLNKIKNIEIFAHNISSGVISISIKNKDSVFVSQILDEAYNICTRSGLHCAGLVHKYYKTLKTGLVRISLSYFNNKNELNKIISALEKIALS